ncbi:hypothetical protein [Mucilaginibacter sp. OK098]|uniref:hypothetical protein n=1 Tax=Mucilaginibacter sp. OK098 TaxID=1855297 RepID=UPI00091F6344|nr:hypothetical protein [Mucilaginibacter sp. OK098]SHM96999.1 hypothetical protein SAMN05216524_104345 [Mucilaginibacter sp. OK098]
MKLSLLIIFTATLFYSCTNNNKKPLSNANELAYNADIINTGALNLGAALTGVIKQGELNAQLKFSNTESKDLEIQEIAINTIDGSHSLPTSAFTPFLLKRGNDTSLTLKFNPYNNYKLYQITGKHGSFKPAYNFSITYKATGSDSTSILSLKATAEKNEYLAYLKKYITPVIGYSFNTTNGFNERQKKYLETLKQIPHPPFAFLSDQEIAVSGFNFRLKNYYQQDTLHAELFIVNHSDFLVKIIPDAFNITASGKSLPGDVKTVSLEKVSGTQQNISMIEKGDRVLIHFKKHIKLNAPGKEHLQLHITKAFMIKGDKALFTEDLELLPASF